MSTDSVTLALNGDVYLSDFAKAIGYFNDLMAGLSESVAKEDQIEWCVDSLETGSAIITLVGRSPRMKSRVSKVTAAYEKAARAAQRNRPTPYGDKVDKALVKLRSILNGRITSIRFETFEFDTEVCTPSSEKGTEKQISTLGAVEGRIQSLTNRGTLRFTLYDIQDDHAVSCYLRGGCEDVMRNAWGKRAIVEGLLRRDDTSGKVLTVRDITEVGVQILDDDAGLNWREAIGCAPATKGSMSAEVAIRKGRDD